MKTLKIFTIKRMAMIIANTARRTGFFTPISFIRKYFGTLPLIVVLNHPIRPSAILSAIIAIVVYAVNRGVFLTKLLCVNFVRFVQVVLKFLKGLPLAFYSSASIVLVRFMRWIIATLMNVHPNKIKSLLGQAVRSSRLAQFFISPAPAGLGVSAFNMMTPYDYNFSTIANTLPHRSSSFGDMRKFKNFQSIKFATRYIKYFHTSSLAKVGKVVKENWGKFLKNKYGGKEVIDPQGNTWMEIDLRPEYKKAPVEAFGIGAGLTAGTTAYSLQRPEQNKRELNF